MLISTAGRWQELQAAREQAKRYREKVPGMDFYQGKLAQVWDRARGTRARSDLPEFSMETFAALPVTSKDQLKEAPWDFAVTDGTDAAKYYETSGTSGRTTPTPRMAEDIIWNTTFVAEAWRSLLTGKQRVLIMLPSDIVPVADLISGSCEYLGHSHIRAYPFTTGIVDWDRLIELWKSFRPTSVFAAPGVALQFTRLLRQRALLDDLQASLETMMLLGEVSTQPLRDRLGQWWRARAFDASYGSTETGTVATACQAGQQHLVSAAHYAELANSAGIRTVSALGHGTGRLIITPLNLHARPLLRQDTGDTVRVGDSCECGSECPVIAIEGRSTEMIELRGVPLSARTVEELVYTTSGTTGYLIERTPTGDYARLLLERDLPGHRVGEDEALATLREAFRERLGITWDDIVFVNSLSSLTKSGAAQKNWKRSNVRVLEKPASRS